MKNLVINNPAFEYLEKGYKEWLDVLGYCSTGVYTMPNSLREFLHYLNTHGVKHINDLTQKHIKAYYQYMSSRPNQRRGGGLSDKYILMQMKALDKFLEYLNHKGFKNVPSLGIRLTTPQQKEPVVLTQQEIKLLFEATQHPTDQIRISKAKQEAIMSRDRVLLVIFYSCGLRRNEGVHVKIDDINFDTRILHVKKARTIKNVLCH
jgi:integrase/recombinase XerD